MFGTHIPWAGRAMWLEHSSDNTYGSLDTNQWIIDVVDQMVKVWSCVVVHYWIKRTSDHLSVMDSGTAGRLGLDTLSIPPLLIVYLSPFGYLSHGIVLHYMLLKISRVHV